MLHATAVRLATDHRRLGTSPRGRGCRELRRRLSATDRAARNGIAWSRPFRRLASAWPI